MLHVASVCTPCCMLLQSCCAKFETDQTFEPTTQNISFVPWSPKRSATSLDPFAPLFQHCWGHARDLHMVSKVLWVISFPQSTAGPNIVESCCVLLHVTCNGHNLLAYGVQEINHFHIVHNTLCRIRNRGLRILRPGCQVTLPGWDPRCPNRTCVTGPVLAYTLSSSVVTWKAVTERGSELD